MLGFGAMGEFALGQVPILPAFSPGVFVGDVAVFLKEQEERSKRERERDEAEYAFQRERRLDIERALDGPPIDYKWTKKTNFYRSPNTLPLAADMVKAQGIMQQVMARRQAEEDEKQLERLLLDL